MPKKISSVKVISNRVNTVNRRLAVDVMLEGTETLEIETVRTILDERGGIWPKTMTPYRKEIVKKARIKAITYGISLK